MARMIVLKIERTRVDIVVSLITGKRPKTSLKLSC